ncbi:hypothetical protein E1B28_000732 [Marasmius oreades]|uniref:RanBD1 domain-containing protein n=1 Tax=Marasmius oreades TaxID=181124 RepID=A0A9P7V1X2_9AGAR|nr:uncharacterized protein E1B28_000732 [Marasmius oreades]KAG7098828.1 hypothetical protein E1B28_000732 [Marasmius oreades]
MKRVAEKQITKDGDYDDDDEAEEQRGFHKADESVLTERKIRALPKRAKVGTTLDSTSVGSGATTEETTPKPSGSTFGLFAGFGAPSATPFPFNPSTPVSNSPSTGASPTATSTAKAFSNIASGVTTNGTSTTSQNSKSSLAVQPTIPDITSHSTLGKEGPAVDYYRSLRGLNVSFLSTISKAVEDDPFVDVSGLLERYKSLRIDIQREHDQKTLKSFTTSTIPSSSFSSKSPTAMPTPPSSFIGFKPSSNPFTSTTPDGGFIPTLDNATSKSSSFSFPSSTTPSSTSKPSFLPFSAPIGATPTTAPAHANFFKDTSKTTNANLFGKPEDSSTQVFSSSTSHFGGPGESNIAGNLFGNPSTTEKFATPSTPPPSGKPTLGAFGGAFGTKTSPGGGSIGNPVGFGFGAGTTTTPFSFGATSGGGSTSGAGKGFSFASSPATQGGSGEPTPTVVEADSNGHQSQGTEDSAVTGMFGPNPHDEEGEGEQDEETVHSVKSKVYKMKKDGEKTSWVELGTGILRLKKHKVGEQRRLLLRNSSNGKININFNLYPGLKPSQSQKVVSFVGHEAGVAQTYSARVKTEDQAIALKDALDREIAFVKAKSAE